MVKYKLGFVKKTTKLRSKVLCHFAFPSSKFLLLSHPCQHLVLSVKKNLFSHSNRCVVGSVVVLKLICFNLKFPGVS